MSCSCCASAKGKLDIDPSIQADVLTAPIRKIAMVRKKKCSVKTQCVKHFALCLYLGTVRAKNLAIIFMDWRKGKEDGAVINVADWTRKPDSRQSYEVVSEAELSGRSVNILTLRDFYNKGASMFDNCRSAAKRMYKSALLHPLPVLDDPNGNCYASLTAEDVDTTGSGGDSRTRGRDDFEKSILTVDMQLSWLTKSQDQ